MDKLKFWKDFLDQVGFPTLFALWLMFRVEKRLEKIVDIHDTLINAIIKKEQ